MKRSGERPSFEYMTEVEERSLRAWESAVEETPLVAWNAGPPSWLVRRQWDEKGKESFVAAAERIKREYFEGGYRGARRGGLRPIRTEYGRKLAVERGYATEEDFRLIDMMEELPGEPLDVKIIDSRGRCECGNALRPRGTTCWSCYRKAQRGN